jgi:sorbitol-specific phosphotransferase system component IIC
VLIFFNGIVSDVFEVEDRLGSGAIEKLVIFLQQVLFEGVITFFSFSVLIFFNGIVSDVFEVEDRLGSGAIEKLVIFLQQVLFEGVIISIACTWRLKSEIVIPNSRRIGIINKNKIKYLMGYINK